MDLISRMRVGNKSARRMMAEYINNDDNANIPI